METLKLGRMTNDELANWFDVQPETLRKKRANYITKLEEYCEFENLRGAVNITKIYNDIYIKRNSKAYQYYLDNLPKVWHFNQIETCSRVAAELFKPENNIKESTGEKYTIAARDEIIGKPTDHTNSHCYYCLAKLYRGAEKKDNRYEPLTEQDEQIMTELYNKYYGTKDQVKKRMLTLEKVRHNEISKEEAYDIMFNEKDYKSYIEKLSAALGCDWVVRGTYVDTNTIEFVDVCPKDGEFNW